MELLYTCTCNGWIEYEARYDVKLYTKVQPSLVESLTYNHH